MVHDSVRYGLMESNARGGGEEGRRREGWEDIDWANFEEGLCPGFEGACGARRGKIPYSSPPEGGVVEKRCWTVTKRRGSVDAQVFGDAIARQVEKDEK